MNLKDYVAVSGLPGFYKLVATRSSGLVIRDIDSDKTRFASSRKHQFTPLESVAIYTDQDSIELSIIFEKIEEKLAELPLPDIKAGKDEVFDYFSKILPDYDTERVFLSDVKKVIKWYKFLSERDLLHKEETSTEVSTEGEDSSESIDNQDDSKK